MIFYLKKLKNFHFSYRDLLSIFSIKRPFSKKFRACGAVFMLELQEFNKKFSKKKQRKGDQGDFWGKFVKKIIRGSLMFLAPAKIFSKYAIVGKISKIISVFLIFQF